MTTYGIQDEDKLNKNTNTICVGHRHKQTNTNYASKTCARLKTTGSKDEPNIILGGNRNGHHNTELRT